MKYFSVDEKLFIDSFFEASKLFIYFFYFLFINRHKLYNTYCSIRQFRFMSNEILK
jgi:hypothetical protein